MYAIELDHQAITLRVADLDRSRQFYEELLGLSGRASGGGVLLEGLADEFEGEAPGQRLRMQLVPGAFGEPDPMWLSVEVAGVTDVLDLYLLAIILGCRAAMPRRKGERWTTVVTDPDGHRLSVGAPVTAEQPPAPGRRTSPPARVGRSPRLEWETSHRRGYDAQQHQAKHTDGIDLNTGHGVHRPVPGRNLDEAAETAGRDELPAHEGV
jgi:catechol 2,3-dioxygenase-like lactoylglutathione lyase family enzyme